jgi:primase-polymerase (primpol)-like protein
MRPAGSVAGDAGDVATVGRDPRWCGPEDDAELLRRMMVHKEPDAALIADLAEKVQAAPGDAFLKWQYDQATRERLPFEWLWNADPRIGQQHADTSGAQGRAFDWSAADQALMNRLAFWTGKDWPRMQRLFGQSALAQREKWQTRPYYSNLTTSSACRWAKDVYKGTKADRRDEERRRQQMRANEQIGDAFREEDHVAPILTLEEMHQRLVYVTSINWFVDRVTFKDYKVDNCEYVFASSLTEIDTGKRDKDTGQPVFSHVPTVKLWLKEHQAQKRIVDKISWKPNGGIICDVPESFNTGVNMWRGLVKPRWADYYRDNLPEREQAIAGWRAHLEYLVPYEVERTRFEKWLAHMLQRPETLPHTAYLMFTPEVGTGRNWLSSVLVRVLRGYVAAGVDIQEVLDGSFNGRLSQKLLAIVDEAKAGMQDAKRYARSERLKTLVNQSAREINVKHGLQSVEHNCMRWLFFSNHSDALPFDNNDRRIAVIANPTQRHSGGSAYYSALYALLDDTAFISAVWAHLMFGVDVSDFNPGEHAPMNEAKRIALSEMQSEGERAVRDLFAKCPGDLITARQVREYIDRYNSDQSGTKAHSRISTALDVRINNMTQKIIIVRNYTAETVNQLDRQVIANIVGKNDIWLKLE